MMGDEVILVTEAEAGRILGVHPRQVQRWIERGHLRSYRVEGRRNRYVERLEAEAIAVELPAQKKA